ncbi:hypothetical protein AOLI_G00077950 [Acnodon oligacanthus]
MGPLLLLSPSLLHHRLIPRGLLCFVIPPHPLSLSPPLVVPTRSCFIIQQFSFIDIIYELVLLGVLRGAKPPVFPRPRGFLSHLMAMLYSISTVSDHRMPTAEEYMFHVKRCFSSWITSFL